MSRTDTKSRYQVGDYWLSQKSNSCSWNRTWFDRNTKQTRRASLRTADFEEAKVRLNEWFILNATKTEPEPNKDVLLANVFARFFDQHAKYLTTSYDYRRSLNIWLDFHEEATIAEALQANAQARFRSYLLNEKKLSCGSGRRSYS